MNKKPSLTTKRTVYLYREMIEVRRMFCADHEFFRMTDFWEDLCDEGGKWSIRTYRSNEVEDFKRKAAIVAFEGRAILTVGERLLANAKAGCKLSNFMLAHEAGHLALDHYARTAVTKHFQLFAGTNGNSNLPPTLHELEANYAAVFLQCGVALEDARWDALRLAHRAFTDVKSVENAQRVVRLDVFQQELNRLRPTFRRVTL